MTTFIGRGPGTSPTTDFFPLSASLPSAPVILVTGDSVASANTIHTADARAYDIPIIYVANVGTTSNMIAYLQMGSTSALQSIPVTIATSSYALIQPGTPISGSGVVKIWASLSSGIVAYGGVTRTYTASA